MGFVLNGVTGGHHLGNAVAMGDFTGDGRADLLAGVPGAAGAALLFGRAQVPMTADGLEASDLVDGTLGPEYGLMYSAPAGFGVVNFAHRIRNLGDLDGDGIDDFGLSARTNTGSGTGEVFVVYGGADVGETFQDFLGLRPELGGDGSKGFTVSALGGGAFLGFDLYGGHDINGSGSTDLIIATHNEYEPGRGNGEAFVLYGRPGRNHPPRIDYKALLNLTADQGFHIVPPEPEVSPLPTAAVFGFQNVRFVNDLTGNGLDEIILCRHISQFPGAPLNGECYLIFGQPGPTPFPPLFDLGVLLERNGGDGSQGMVIVGRPAGCLGGAGEGGFVRDAVASLGDFDGDGYNDLLIGAGGCGVDGRVYVLYGQAGFPAELHLSALDDPDPLPVRITEIVADPLPVTGPFPWPNRFGTTATALGDYSGNGWPDIALSQRVVDETNNYWNQVWVLFGRADLPAQIRVNDLLPENGGDGRHGFLVRPMPTIPSERNMGASIATGDFTGNGALDLALGGPGMHPGFRFNAGRVIVLHGQPPPVHNVPTMGRTSLALLIMVVAGVGLVTLILAARRQATGRR